MFGCNFDKKHFTCNPSVNGLILKHEHCFSFNKYYFSSILQSHLKIKWMFVVQVCLPSQLWAKCCARSLVFCPWRWSATMCVTRATWGPSSEQLQRLGARKSWPPKVSVGGETEGVSVQGKCVPQDKSNPSIPAQSQGAHTINRLEERAWEEEALDDLLWKDAGGPSSIRWTLD